MSPNEPPGPIPTVQQAPVGSQPYIPMPQNGRAKPWTIIGLLGVMGAISGGYAWIADRVYLDKETYRLEREADTKRASKEREVDIKDRAELKATVTTLKTSVDKLNDKIGDWNLGAPVRRRPR